jgi:hypothetical protein
MSYKCSDSEYIDVSLKDLIFGPAIKLMVVNRSGSFPTELEHCIQYTGAFNLTLWRLVEVQAGYDLGLPAISITEDKRVINGRHRVAATILRGGKTIPCKISPPRLPRRSDV